MKMAILVEVLALETDTWRMYDRFVTMHKVVVHLHGHQHRYTKIARTLTNIHAIVDHVLIMSSIDQRLDQNVMRNLLSRSEMIDCGITRCTHTQSKKSLAVPSVVIFFLRTTIMAILENLSTTTKTKSFSCLVEEMPCFLMVSLEMAQAVQDLMYFLTSCQIFGQ